VLKNSFRGISRTKFARKLLNLRLPQALKFTQITALVPISTATPVRDNWRPERLQNRETKQPSPYNALGHLPPVSGVKTGS
jgi:hypothetical protein